MKLAAVILNYKDALTTIDAARRIDGFSCIDHIVIVDNASPDGSAGKITEAFHLKEHNGSTPEVISETVNSNDKASAAETKIGPKITLLKAPKNGGYGYGNNMGVKYAAEKLEAELVLIANPDACFDEALILRMRQSFAEDDRAAVVGAVMHEEAASAVTDTNDADKGEDKDKGKNPSALTYEEYLLSGWKERDLLEEVLHSGPLCKRFLRKKLDYPEEYYKKTAVKGEKIPVYAVHGSLLMVNTRHFLSVGGYDPQMFLYMEEYTLAHRCRKAGLKTYLIPASYSHEGSHSITGAGFDAIRRQKLRQASERRYYRECLGAGALQMIAVRAFQEFVLLETRLAAGCRLI